MNRLLKLLLPLLWGGLAFLLVTTVGQLTYNNDHWLPDENPNQQARDLLSKEFEQSAEQLLITITLNDDFFTEKTINRFNELSDDLLDIEHIKEINSPLEATVILEDNETLQIQSYRRALEKNTLKNYQEFKQRLTESPYYGLLISKDYSIAAISVMVDSFKKSDIREKALSDIYQLLAEYSDLGAIAVAGDVRLKAQLNSSTKTELARLLAIAALVLSAFLLLIFGQFWRIGLLFGTAGLCVLSALSIVVLFGHHLTIISLTLPVMIVVIALADCLHIMGYWDDMRRKEDFATAGALLKKVMGYSWRPCLNTSITTAIGFGSFALSDILPLQEFGRDAAIAVMVAYFIMLLSMASGLWYVSWRKPSSSLETKNDLIITNILNHVLFIVKKRTKTIIAISLLFLGVTGTALGWARTETNLLDVFFKPQSEIYRAFTLVDEKLGGSGSVDVIFTKREEEFFRTYQPFSEAVKLEKILLADFPLVQGVQSYIDPIREVHVYFSEDESAEPDSDEELNQELLFLDFSRSADKQDVLAPYLDFNAERIRIKLQLPNLDSTRLGAIIAQLEETLTDIDLPEPIITGHSAFFQTLSTYVVNTQLSSISLTFMLIFIVLMVQFGSLVAGIGILATTLPVVMTLGTVSLLGLPFDFATVIIAAVAMGISVDDNIHIIHCYVTTFKRTGNHEKAIEAAMMIPGKPVLKTSLLFMLGIGLFITSDLVILTRFGIFATEAMFLAWFSATMFLPALLNLFRKTLTKKYQTKVAT